jgi:hypothetical protein
MWQRSFSIQTFSEEAIVERPYPAASLTPDEHQEAIEGIEQDERPSEAGMSACGKGGKTRSKDDEFYHE